MSVHGISALPHCEHISDVYTFFRACDVCAGAEKGDVLCRGLKIRKYMAACSSGQGISLVQSQLPASAPERRPLPQAEMEFFWPHPLSSLVSLSQSLQSLTITRKLLPIAELNSSPPIHSFLLIIFSDLGAPPLDVQYGMKQSDKAAALGHSADSIPSNPHRGFHPHQSLVSERHISSCTWQYLAAASSRFPLSLLDPPCPLPLWPHPAGLGCADFGPGLQAFCGSLNPCPSTESSQTNILLTTQPFPRAHSDDAENLSLRQQRVVPTTWQSLCFINIPYSNPF